jgi:hypothetical protein
MSGIQYIRRSGWCNCRVTKVSAKNVAINVAENVAINVAVSVAIES